MKSVNRATLLLPALIVLTGCGPRQVPMPVDGNCLRPTQYIINGVDLSVGASTIGKVATGAISVKTNPEVAGLLSEVANDQIAITYVACLNQRNGYTAEQAQHQIRLLQFYGRANPNADHVLEYLKTDPPPGVQTAGGVTVDIPADHTLLEALRFLATIDRASLSIGEDCSGDILNGKLYSTVLAAPTVRDLMVNLGLNLVNVQPRPLVVTFATGVYNVTCGE